MRKLLIAAALLSLASRTPAYAQQEPEPIAQCAPWREQLAVLRARFDERPLIVAQSNVGPTMAFLVSPAGTYTVLAIQPDGSGCVVDTGEGWRAVPAGEPS